MSSRKGIRARFRRRKASRKSGENRLESQTERVRAQAREAADRNRAGARRARVRRHRAQIEELGVWTKGSLLEIRRRARLGWRATGRRLAPVTSRVGKLLAPLGRALGAVLGPVASAIRALLAPIAPYVSGGLFLVLRGVGAVVAGLLNYTLVVLDWVRARALATARWVRKFYADEVTPIRTAAVLAAGAAVVLAIAQFIDYREITIGGEQLPGEAGDLTPATRIEVKPTGDPHAYALLPLALIALALTWFAFRGRWKLGRLVALIGGIGMLVALGIDAPKGLDAGNAGEAYEGTKAYLLTGFWLEFGACLVLIVSGLALAHYVREGRERPRREHLRAPLAAEAGDRTAPPPSPFGSGAGA